MINSKKAHSINAHHLVITKLSVQGLNFAIVISEHLTCTQKRMKLRVAVQNRGVFLVEMKAGGLKASFFFSKCAYI